MGGGSGADRGEGAVACPTNIMQAATITKTHSHLITYKWEVDEHGNDCEQGHNKRNDMDAENVEHGNSRDIPASSGKASPK
jgi:hypothetical protein